MREHDTEEVSGSLLVRFSGVSVTAASTYAPCLGQRGAMLRETEKEENRAEFV